MNKSNSPQDLAPLDASIPSESFASAGQATAPWSAMDDGPLSGVFSTGDQRLRLRMWFVQMRWIACGVLACFIVLSVWIMNYLPHEVFWPLAFLLACLVGTNVVYSLCLRRRWLDRCIEDLQILSDLLLLTAMLHFSGGIENPAIFACVFHVIISGILQNRRRCYGTVVLASLLLGGLAYAELSGLIEHYTLQIFPHVEEADGLHHAAANVRYAVSVVSLQIILMSLTAYFTTAIMERLRVEQNRATAEHQRLQHVLQATGAGFAILDRDLRPVWMNDQIKDWLGIPEASPGEVSELFDVVNRFERWTGGRSGPAAETFEDGLVRVVERHGAGADGGGRFFQVTVAPLTDQSGSVYQVVELTQDITQRKLLEAEMMHSAKMAALGMMAAGIAHEVGNPLASISTRLRLMQEEHDEGFVRESVLLLQEQTRRIARIAHGISQIARPARNEWTTLQVNDVVTEVLTVLRLNRPAKGSQIVPELADGLSEIRGVRDQLVQVCLNLGLNALDAMPRRGVLTVRTGQGGGDIWIEFSDTGEGVADDIRERIFDPFFSTKDTGQGLGLWLVRNMVNAHGGRIEVRDNEGGGTVFTVILPTRPREPGAAPNGKDVNL